MSKSSTMKMMISERYCYRRLFGMLSIVMCLVTIIDAAPLTSQTPSSSSSLDAAKRNRNDDYSTSNFVRIPSALCGGKSRDLGMESGAILDAQISSSSSYNLQSTGPQNARLNRELAGGAWCPVRQLNAEYSGTEWLQVDLQRPMTITAVATQGRFGNGMGAEFVEQYWIEYSRDNGTTWKKWEDANGEYKLPGNHDTYTAHRNILSHPLVDISLIRIVPFASYDRTTCMRFELYGCETSISQPITYSMPEGVKVSSLGDLTDKTYDGRRDFYGTLSGGLGQLTDGIKGDDNYKVNYGYEWIGWRAEPGTDLSIVFQFDDTVNFTSATLHTHNMFNKGVQVFSSARIWFSYDGQIWSRRPIEFDYMPDDVLENARDVIVHLHHRVGNFVKFDLRFAAPWLMISEILFDAQPLDNNVTLTDEHLESPFDSLLPISSAIDERVFLAPTAFFIIVAVVGVVLCLIIALVLRNIRGKDKAGQIVVCMKDLATTPLYCEPKDFSSTSSTISNTVSDPEYAVPDVAIASSLANPNLRPLAGQALHSSSGHLNNNLNMFGANFTRIFASNLKGSNNGVVPSSATLGPQGNAKNSTSNVAYSTQKFPVYSVDSNQMITSTANGSSYSVNRVLANARQMASGQNQHYQNSLLNSDAMTSNTIYNNNNNNKNNPKHKLSSQVGHTLYQQGVGAPTNGLIINPMEQYEETKCIPEVSESDIEIVRKQWGQSRYGEILLGRFRCDDDKDSETFVVLKTLESDKLRSEFVHEMKSKWFISAKSERIAKLFGHVSINTGAGRQQLAMVLECANCDLTQFLPACDKKTFGIRELLHIGTEVAAGMKYLESLGHVHRDLSARNCIAYTGNGQLRIKITDIASLLNGHQGEYCNGVSLRWCAPEALVAGQFSTKSDVYSFGVTLWEILTYCLVRPHHEIDDEAVLAKIFAAYESFTEGQNDANSCIYYQATYGGSIQQQSQQQQPQQQSQLDNIDEASRTRLSYRLALPRPTICPGEIFDLMCECWQLNEHLRPSFRDIYAFLQQRCTAFDHHQQQQQQQPQQQSQQNMFA